MNILRLSVFGLCAIVFFPGHTAMAADARPDAAFEFTSVNVERHPEIRYTLAKNLVGLDDILFDQTLVPEKDQALVSVLVWIRPKWKEPSDKILLDAKQHVAIVDGETRIAPIGSWGTRWCYRPLENYSPTIFAAPVNGAIDKPQAVFANFVFLVPESSKTLALSIRDVSATVPFPGKLTSTDAKLMLTPQILSTKLVDAMKRQNLAGGPPEATNPGGKILLLEMDYTPKAASEFTRPFEGEAPGFNLYSYGLTISYKHEGKVIHSASMGAISGDSLSKGVQFGGAPGPKSGRTWHKGMDGVHAFAVPANLKAFTIEYMGWPIGEGRVTR